MMGPRFVVVLPPKKCSSQAGVTNIPKRFPSMALHKAVATLALAALERNTHMLIVVGRHVVIRIPSSSSSVGRNFDRKG
jgi:hypothetical protein